MAENMVSRPGGAVVPSSGDRCFAPVGGVLEIGEHRLAIERPRPRDELARGPGTRRDLAVVENRAEELESKERPLPPTGADPEPGTSLEFAAQRLAR